MELQDYLNVVRKRWRTIALVALVVMALAAAYTIASTKVYSSTTQFFVSTAGGDVSQLQQGNTFTQQRVKSYAQLIETPRVLDPVIADLGLDASAEKLAEQVTATVPLDTVLIDVEVTADSPQEAASIAVAIGESFPATVAEIEKVSNSQPSPVKITLVKPAEADSTPVSPRPTRNLALGLALGLLAGFGMALIRDLLDTSVRSSKDLEEVTDKTVIGSIAFDEDAASHPLVVQVDPRSHRAEAFRSIRTNLQFVDVADPPRSIVITSSLPGEGKTTTAANLAITLAETGSSVCVIEGDLRRPRLLDYLGYEGSVGLTDVLVGRAEVQDVLQPFTRKGLWILGAGALPPNPSELLGSPNMAGLVDRLTASFDYVIIDAPPLLPVTDAAVLTTVVDGAAVVVGAGVVAKEQLRLALASLESVNGHVLGIILNRVQQKAIGSAESYSYGYTSETERERAKARKLRLEDRPARRA